MASWSRKKQLIYGSVAGLFVVAVLSVPTYYAFFNKSESCFDGVLNQDELNIDCGGGCAKVCSEEAREPFIIFERFFETSYQTYSLLANIENTNQGVYTTEANYVFRTYDKDNVLLDERYGKTYIAPNSTFPILEYGVYVGERTPFRTIFSFVNPIDWRRGEFKEPLVSVSNIKTSENLETPSITASIKNNEVYELKNIKALVVVYDVDNNTIGTSQTIIDRLSSKESKDVTFTWNLPFDKPVSRVDIFPRALPRDLK